MLNIEYGFGPRMAIRQVKKTHRPPITDYFGTPYKKMELFLLLRLDLAQVWFGPATVRWDSSSPPTIQTTTNHSTRSSSSNIHQDILLHGIAAKSLLWILYKDSCISFLLFSLISNRWYVGLRRIELRRYDDAIFVKKGWDRVREKDDFRYAPRS